MPNRLADESSPYLLQHAENPVDWYPWSEEALTHARERDVPILLSIGYSTCHWCHVMAHESFENEATARLMNADFVNIKVDREERPDIDRIYQAAHQILTRSSGGWPLTMFLDPQTHQPFFGGTYFPPNGRYGLPGFSDILRRVTSVWKEKREELDKQGEQLQAFFDALNPASDEPPVLTDAVLFQQGRDELARSYDATWGGFGDAPKFPMPTALEFLLRHFVAVRQSGDNDGEALDMVIRTLTQMARGGIYDHLGGGFCRYATDRKWMVPHFEKMLYDNGPLLQLYSDALTFGPDPLFEAAIRETVGWLQREMTHPEGGFFSSLDADSEGEEGRFYVWRREQVRRLLSEDEYLVVETLYGLDKPANFENRWNLHRWDAWLAVVDRLSMDRGEAETLLASARAKMFEAREKRPRPFRDEKILTSWNALMIKGLARAGQQLNEPDWVDTAARAVDFLRESVFLKGRLHAVWKDGQARHNGYLDDYANLLDAVLMLLQVRWRNSDYEFALELADGLIERFVDEERGGFYFTSDDHEQLIHRPKPMLDDSVPAGNAIAARTLLLLGHLSGETRYIDVADATLRWARHSLEQLPSAHPSLLNALRDLSVPPIQVVIRGPAEQIEEWHSACQPQTWNPGLSVWAIPLGGTPLRRPPAYLPRMVSADDLDRPVAWVCSNLSCSTPIRELEALRAELP